MHIVEKKKALVICWEIPSIVFLCMHFQSRHSFPCPSLPLPLHRPGKMMLGETIIKLGRIIVLIIERTPENTKETVFGRERRFICLSPQSRRCAGGGPYEASPRPALET